MKKVSIKLRRHINSMVVLEKSCGIPLKEAMIWLINNSHENRN